MKVGLIADSGGVLRLPRRLPRAVATELMLTGRRLGAAEAAGWGLVNQVAERPYTALERALSLAHNIREGAPLAVAAVKEVLRATEQLGIEDAYARMRDTDLQRYRAMLTSADAQEGPRAFAEKPAPHWTGAVSAGGVSGPPR